MTSFALRLPDHIMEQVKVASAEDKVSINQMLVSIIAEGLGARRGMKRMKERAARADMDAALAFLDHVVPDALPDAGHERHDEAASGSQVLFSRPVPGADAP